MLCINRDSKEKTLLSPNSSSSPLLLWMNEKYQNIVLGMTAENVFGFFYSNFRIVFILSVKIKHQIVCKKLALNFQSVFFFAFSSETKISRLYPILSWRLQTLLHLISIESFFRDLSFSSPFWSILFSVCLSFHLFLYLSVCSCLFQSFFFIWYVFTVS
jgi:hypothetical protein